MWKQIAFGLLTIGLVSSLVSAETARAKITGTKIDSRINGSVLLRDTTGGLRIDAEFTQSPPGQHGFHIHEFGSCADAGIASGSHFNPAGHPHGDALTEGIDKTHAGDFGNITIDKEGNGSLHVLVPHLTVSDGEFNVAGRALIFHEKPDDFSQPVGNAGARIGCGPIIITKD